MGISAYVAFGNGLGGRLLFAPNTCDLNHNGCVSDSGVSNKKIKESMKRIFGVFFIALALMVTSCENTNDKVSSDFLKGSWVNEEKSCLFTTSSVRFEKKGGEFETFRYRIIDGNELHLTKTIDFVGYWNVERIVKVDKDKILIGCDTFYKVK